MYISSHTNIHKLMHSHSHPHRCSQWRTTSREWLFGCLSALGIFSRFTFLFLAIPLGLFSMSEILYWASN